MKLTYGSTIKSNKRFMKCLVACSVGYLLLSLFRKFDANICFFGLAGGKSNCKNHTWIFLGIYVAVCLLLWFTVSMTRKLLVRTFFESK